MKVLLLGGTGAMGTHLCNILAREGYEVFVSTRIDREIKSGITYVKGDAHDLLFLNTLLSGNKWDAIVDFMVYSTDEFKQRVEQLLDATSEYVFISSARVYAESKQPITEESPRLLDVCTDINYLRTDEYALKKARQENILKECDKKNWTIIRPYVTFSENRIQLSQLEKEYWLYRALKGRTIVFSKDVADKLTTFTYGYDVAKGIASLIGKEKALGEAFHITVGESHRWKEILDSYIKTIEEVTGKRPKVMMIDNCHPSIGGGGTQVKYDRLYDRQFDNSKISQFVDTSLFRSTIPAVCDCLREFLRHPKFQPIVWALEAKKDRLTGDWTAISEIKGLKNIVKYYLIRLGLYK